MIAAARAIAAVLAVIALGLPARAAPQDRCEAVNAEVVADDAADRANACAGAAAAFAFFEALGLATDETVVIEVLPELPAAAPPGAAGGFQHRRRRVVVLGYAAFRRHRSWFDVPIDRAMHRSVFAHEVAHALTAVHAPSWSDISWHGREYVAYVTMLATMPPALRERVLSAQPGTGFEHVVEITPLVLAFDPALFAAEAYRHYLKPGHGAEFVRRVIRGEALTE